MVVGFYYFFAKCSVYSSVVEDDLLDGGESVGNASSSTSRSGLLVATPPTLLPLEERSANSFQRAVEPSAHDTDHEYQGDEPDSRVHTRQAVFHSSDSGRTSAAQDGGTGESGVAAGGEDDQTGHADSPRNEEAPLAASPMPVAEDPVKVVRLHYYSLFKKQLAWPGTEEIQGTGERSLTVWLVRAGLSPWTLRSELRGLGLKRESVFDRYTDNKPKVPYLPPVLKMLMDLLTGDVSDFKDLITAFVDNFIKPLFFVEAGTDKDIGLRTMSEILDKLEMLPLNSGSEWDAASKVIDHIAKKCKKPHERQRCAEVALLKKNRLEDWQNNLFLCSASMII